MISPAQTMLRCSIVAGAAGRQDPRAGLASSVHGRPVPISGISAFGSIVLKNSEAPEMPNAGREIDSSYDRRTHMREGVEAPLKARLKAKVGSF